MLIHVWVRDSGNDGLDSENLVVSFGGRYAG